MPINERRPPDKSTTVYRNFLIKKNLQTKNVYDRSIPREVYEKNPLQRYLNSKNILDESFDSSPGAARNPETPNVHRIASRDTNAIFLICLPSSSIRSFRPLAAESEMEDRYLGNCTK